MTLTMKEMDALRAQIDTALVHPGTTGFERQFLAGQKARLDQHGTHAMVTPGQNARIQAICLRAAAHAGTMQLSPGH